MKKRMIGLLLVGVMALSTLVGCSNNSTVNDTNASTVTDNKNEGTDTAIGEESPAAEDMAEVASEPITISYWCNFTGSDGDVLREIVKRFNETNTDNITVEIDIMDYQTLQAKLPTAISTGTGPSFILAGVELMKQYKENDMLEPINDFWDVTGVDKSNFYESVLAKSYIDGEQYGVPMQYNLQYLYYNKDIFADAGLDPEKPPKTLDELAEYAKACTDPSKNQYGLGLPVDYGNYVEYLWANGGDVINSDATENLLNSEANIKTLTWLQDMMEAGVSPKGFTAADADTMFQAGQLAMTTNGPWNINGLNQLGINYGITAIPGGSDGAYSPEGGCAWMLSKGADDATRVAVYKYMAFWLSDDILKEWSNRNGFPVWSYSVLKDSEIQGNKILADVSAASEIGRDWHLGLAIGSQIDNDVMKPMIEKILSGEDVAACVQEASDILDGVIAQ